MRRAMKAGCAVLVLLCAFANMAKAQTVSCSLEVTSGNSTKISCSGSVQLSVAVDAEFSDVGSSGAFQGVSVKTQTAEDRGLLPNGTRAFLLITGPPGAAVTFSSANITNAVLAVDYIVAFSGLQVTFTSATFQSCWAHTSCLLLSSADSVITSSTFTGPQSGAVDCLAGTLSVFQSNFSGCSSQACINAGITVPQIQPNFLRVSGSRFENNSNRAINTGPNVTALIEFSSFSKNTASTFLTFRGGGAIQFENRGPNVSINVNDCTFENNYVVDLRPKKGNGGALLIYVSTATVRDSFFRNNTMGYGNGGAIYSFNGIIRNATRPDTLQIRNCTFVKNYTPYYFGDASEDGGGAILILPAVNGGLGVYDCTFDGNIATSGSAIVANGVYVNIDNCTFINTPILKDRSNVDQQQGVVQALGQNGGMTTLVTRSTFRDNQATGVLFIYPDCVALQGNLFQRNGAAFLFLGVAGASCVDRDPILFNRSTVTGDSAFFDDFFGRSIGTGISADIRDNIFEDNAIESKGGALYSESSTNILFVNNVFRNNTSLREQGGAAYFTRCLNVLFWNCTFEGNKAASAGGAVVNNLMFNPNIGDASNYVQHNSLMLANCTVKNNRATIGGAAFGTADVAIEFSNGTVISGNRADHDGGAVYCNACQQLRFFDVILEGNHAASTGGAVSCKDCTYLGMYRSTFANNSASFGGAVYISGPGLTLLESNDTSFSYNQAQKDGGAIQQVGGVSVFQRSEFLKNSALGGFGGGLQYTEENFLLFVDFLSTPHGYPWENARPSLATASGNCSQVVLNNTEFSYNSAKTGGGAIFGTSSASINVTCPSAFSSDEPILTRFHAGVDTISDFPPWIPDGEFTKSGTLQSYNSPITPSLLPNYTVPSSVPLEIFQTERYGQNSTPISLVISNEVFRFSNLKVRIYFAENFLAPGELTYRPTGGVRVFGILVNGEIIDENLDLVDRFGYYKGAMVEAIAGPVPLGTLNITLAPILQNPMYNAIEVLATKEVPNIGAKKHGRDADLASPAPLDSLIPATCPSWIGNSHGPSGYGADVAFPSSRLVISASEEEKRRWTQFQSTLKSLLMFNVSLYDNAGQLVSGSETLLEASASPNNFAISGQREAYAERGVAIFDSLVFRSAPGNYVISITVPGSTSVVPVSFALHVRPCFPGEVTSLEGDTCEPCPAGTYTFTAGQQNVCQPCPTGATCPGGAILVPDVGYWHSAPNSTLIHRCAKESACGGRRNWTRQDLEACQQAFYEGQSTTGECQVSTDLATPNSYMNLLCSPGYEGELCGRCTTSELFGKHASGSRFECKKCSSTGAVLAVALGSFLGALIFLSYNINMTLRDNLDDLTYTQVQISDLLKIAVTYMQYMTILIPLEIGWPVTIQWLPKTISLLFASSAGEAVSADCLLSRDPAKLAFQRLGRKLAGPLVSIAIISLGFVAVWVRKRHSLVWLRSRVMVTILTITFFFFPNLVSAVLECFACYSLDNTEDNPFPENNRATWKYGYWLRDMNQRCYEGWHLLLTIAAALPVALVICILVPLLPTLLLYKHRKDLQSPDVRHVFGFIYHSYKPNFWFWESVTLFEKAAVVALSVFAQSTKVYYQALSMVTFLILLLLMVLGVSPYAFRTLKHLQAMADACVLATAIGATYFVLNFDKTANQEGLDALGVVILLSNAVFISVFLWFLSRIAWKKTTVVYRRFRDKFGKDRRFSETTNCIQESVPAPEEVL